MHKKVSIVNINIRNGVVLNLKSTGVIRRIDELGRIVIPKEIRRNLGIRDGENVEIFTESDSIILKKYYRMTTNRDLAKNLCDLINNELNYKIIITDREKVIATGGLSKDLEGINIPKDYLNIIEEREIKTENNTEIVLDSNILKGNFIYIPIISLNDSIGLIIMYNENTLENELSVGKLAASIFAKKLDI